MAPIAVAGCQAVRRRLRLNGLYTALVVSGQSNAAVQAFRLPPLASLHPLR